MPETRPRVYWDACVFLSWIDADEEERHAQIGPLFEQAERGAIQIVTSTLSMVEVAFAASEKAAHELDDDMLKQINNLWASGGVVTLVDFHPLIAERARDLVRSTLVGADVKTLKPADSVHLASAIQVNAVRFLTYDADLLKLSNVAGIDLDIREPESDNPFLPGLSKPGR